MAQAEQARQADRVEGMRAQRATAFDRIEPAPGPGLQPGSDLDIVAPLDRHQREDADEAPVLIAGMPHAESRPRQIARVRVKDDLGYAEIVDRTRLDET